MPYALLQAGEQKCLDVIRHSQAADHLRPKFHGRRSDQFTRQGDDVQVVVEVIAAAAMLRPAEDARVTFAIVTNAAEIRPAFVG